MWFSLKQTYKNKSMTNKLNLLTRLINLRMNESDKIEAHYHVLEAIIGELRLAGVAQADDTEHQTAVLLASIPASLGQAVLPF